MDNKRFKKSISFFDSLLEDYLIIESLYIKYKFLKKITSKLSDMKIIKKINKVVYNPKDKNLVIKASVKNMFIDIVYDILYMNQSPADVRDFKYKDNNNMLFSLKLY